MTLKPRNGFGSIGRRSRRRIATASSSLMATRLERCSRLPSPIRISTTRLRAAMENRMEPGKPKPSLTLRVDPHLAAWPKEERSSLGERTCAQGVQATCSRDHERAGKVRHVLTVQIVDEDQRQPA
jgi:hypothetical protein